MRNVTVYRISQVTYRDQQARVALCTGQLRCIRSLDFGQECPEALYIFGKEYLCTGEAIVMLVTIRLDGESLHSFLNAVSIALPAVMPTPSGGDFHADNQ